MSASEMRVLEASVKAGEFSAASLAGRLGIDRTTVQKAVGKLLAKGLLKRSQKNREKGGYEFHYSSPPPAELRGRVRAIASEWFAKFGSQLESWP